MQLDASSMANQFIAIVAALTPTWAFVFRAMKNAREDKQILIDIVQANTKATTTHSLFIAELKDWLKGQNGIAKKEKDNGEK